MKIDMQKLLKAAAGFSKPGEHTIISIQHDDDCPGAHGDPDNCVCIPTILMHHDLAYYQASVRRNRAQRRAAERAERKATANARREGGAK